MTAPQHYRKPTFLWQGALILVPVAVLVTAGLWTLRQDRVAIEHDARLRAEPVAAATLTELKKQLHPIGVTFREDGHARTLSSGRPEMWFELRADSSLDQRWQFTWPPTPAPFPTNLVARMNPDRARLWEDAGVAYQAGDWDKAIELYSAFAAEGGIVEGQLTSPTDGVANERLRGEANYRIACARERLGQTNQAIEAYDAVLLSFRSPSNINDTRSEAGLPLTHLAALRIFQLAGGHDDLPHRWQTNCLPLLQLLREDGSPFGGELIARFQAFLAPTPEDMTLPEHLEKLSGERRKYHLKVLEKNFNWPERSQCESWRGRQETWRLFQEASANHPSRDAVWPARFWVDGDYWWLAVLQEPADAESITTGRRVFCALPESRLAEELARITKQADPLGLFAVKADICGRSTDADASSRFTLSEVVLYLLGRDYISSNNYAISMSQIFPFPDLSRIRIQRSSPSIPTDRKEIVVNLLTATNSIACTKDVTLEFGDVIEIPEHEHALSDQPVVLTSEQINGLEKCTARKVRFAVKGETTELPLSGKGAFLRLTLQYGEVQRILRSSSDLARIKVKRTDSKTGNMREIIVDAQANYQASGDLWLRDGDVIEVPDKP